MVAVATLVPQSALYAADAPPLPTLGDIETAWVNRSRTFESGAIDLSIQRFWAKGSITMFGSTEVFPPQDASFEFTGTVKFSGPMLRYSYDEPIWNERASGFFRDQQLKTFDGTMGATLKSNPPGATFSYQGHVSNDANQIERLHVLHPFFFLVRPTNYAIQMLQEYTVDRWEQSLEGPKYLVLTSQKANGSVRRMLLDPGLGFALKRIDRHSGGKLVYELDIEYSVDAQGVFFLQSWSLNNYFDGARLQDSFRVTVKSHDFQSPVPEHDFRVNYPPLTLIFDSTRDASEASGGKFLVLKDGSRRPVTDAELRVATLTAETLAVTKPGEAVLASRGSRREWIWILLFVAIAVVIALGVARKGRHAVTRV